MYLSNLDIIGFKSFANKTKFKFSDGITALVGPNGCGKTNIVDAIRWVLGEQKKSILRSDIMEDVIFNGTRTRKPLGMAEVILTLQNTKQILPTEYSEVTITRRLFKNGESQYLLNNTQCRLRDISDLFMDTGMGADSYSVIELKMVEAILSGKPEERRGLVEEAAGVRKYKQRRKEASRKLQNIQNDLLRITDIVSEVEKLVNSLYRQASKTRRFNKLTEELKSLEVNLLYHQFDNYNNQSITLNDVFDNIKQKKHEKSRELQEDEKSFNGLKDKLSALEDKYQQMMEKENSLNIKISTSSKDIAVTNEKISSLIAAQERIENELSENEKSNENIMDNLAKTKESMNNLKAQRQIIETELSDKQKERDELKDKVMFINNELSSKNDEIRNNENKITNNINEIENGKNTKEKLLKSIEQGKKEINGHKVNLENQIKEIELQESKKQDYQKSIENLENTIKQSQEEKISLNTDIENLRDNITQKNNELNKKQASLDFLESLIDSDDTTKYLLKESDWIEKDKAVLLSDILEVDEEYRVGLAAALGEYSNYIVVDNKKAAENAISKLKESNKGKASFICKDMIPSVDPPDSSNHKHGVIHPVSEIVRTDEKIKNVLRIILGNTLLVKNSETAWKVTENGNVNCAVTLDGEIIRNKAFIRGGSKSPKEGLSIGKQDRINKIKSDIYTLKNVISELEKKLKDTKQKFDNIDLMDFTNQLRNLQSEKSKHDDYISRLNYNARTIEQNISVLLKNNELFQSEIANIDERKNVLENDIKTTEEKLAAFKEEQSIKSAELKNYQDKLRIKEDEYHETEIKKLRYDQQVISLEKDLETLNIRITELEENRSKRKKEKELNNDDIENYRSLTKELDEEIIILSKQLDEIKTNKSLIGKDISNLKEEISGLSLVINQLRKEYDKLIEEIHQQELKLNELNTKLENVVARAYEAYEIDLRNTDIVLDDSFSIDETKNEVNSIKNKLANLGNVNFMALEEYEVQNERLQFYSQQVEDLKNSEINLLETIEEINHTAQEKFNETFGYVNNHFKTLFKTLFGKDGEAELMLADGDPLEADIEIIAKPPGKRPRSIEGLSGGEKTLTAIALLFAIYLVKPSPFCILDEVDAPLDDANIDRFINLIRDFSKDTQFLIVTHNKKTMEEADSLYGITMEEEGVSKVVSVRLTKENNN
jgi:chromosome segregation protein